jgi:hypothetical protein
VFEAQAQLTLLGQLLHFITILDLVDKDLCRFEARDKLLVDNDSGVA